MEQALQSRLNLRLQHVIELTEQAKAMVESETSIPLVQVTQLCMQLKLAIAALDKEALLYIEKCGDKEGLASQCTNDQMKAEEVLVILESLSKWTVDEGKPREKTPEQTSRLPKLELSKFSGDILKWTEFYDKFEANIGSRNLKDVDKLSYLLGCLQGAALQTVEGLGATNANYAIAIEALLKRYGAKDKVIDAHYAAINNLDTAANIHSECRRNLNSIERHLRILATHGENVDSNHLRVTISSKFPGPVLYQVRLLSKDTTIAELRECLGKVVAAMEESETQTPSSSTPAANVPESSTEALHSRSVMKRQGNKRFLRPKGQEYHRVNFAWDRKRKASMTRTPENKKPKGKCVFCDLGHFSDQCEKYATLEERKKILGNKCYSCYKGGHRANKCYKAASVKCYYCKGKHTSALCEKKFAVATNGNGKTNTQ